MRYTRIHTCARKKASIEHGFLSIINSRLKMVALEASCQISCMRQEVKSPGMPGNNLTIIASNEQDAVLKLWKEISRGVTIDLMKNLQGSSGDWQLTWEAAKRLLAAQPRLPWSCTIGSWPKIPCRHVWDIASSVYEARCPSTPSHEVSIPAWVWAATCRIAPLMTPDDDISKNTRPEQWTPVWQIEDRR